MNSVNSAPSQAGPRVAHDVHGVNKSGKQSPVGGREMDKAMQSLHQKVRANTLAKLVNSSTLSADQKR